VRPIGIDTPETKKPGTAVECGGREATASMLGLAFSTPKDSDGDGLVDQSGGEGRQVRLTTDPTQDRFDRYRRLLAYVRTSGTFINEAQIASGWASVYVYEGKYFRELGRLGSAQGVAWAAGRGVWGKCGGERRLVTAELEQASQGTRGRPPCLTGAMGADSGGCRR
jgi:micrococcal nuclease